MRITSHVAILSKISEAQNSTKASFKPHDVRLGDRFVILYLFVEIVHFLVVLIQSLPVWDLV